MSRSCLVGSRWSAGPKPLQHQFTVEFGRLWAGQSEYVRTSQQGPKRANCEPAAAHFLLRRSRTIIACARFQSLAELNTGIWLFSAQPPVHHRLVGLPVQALVLHQLKVHRCDAFQQVKLRETAWAQATATSISTHSEN